MPRHCCLLPQPRHEEDSFTIKGCYMFLLIEYTDRITLFPMSLDNLENRLDLLAILQCLYKLYRL